MLRISVVIPCYNMEKYIEDTIRSVVSQGYPNLELIVVDGDSSDGTKKILDRYKEEISVLISERDGGQYFAVNKGLGIATGDVVCWLNADDTYFPWTLKMVDEIFRNHESVFWISGATSTMREDGMIKSLGGKGMAKPSGKVAKGYFRQSMYGYLQNEGMFWRREVQERCGLVDTSFRLAGDYELWTRFARDYELVSVFTPLASFRTRVDSRSKAFAQKYEEEVEIAFKHLSKRWDWRLYLPSNNYFNQLKRMTAFSRGLVYYWNPYTRKFTLRLARTNMLYLSIRDLVRFGLDLVFKR
ncbi:glycosyltransferase [Akkermansiaceae bacterium]|nr:glycosyltransferase [Akkermansiaceae bacterium]